MPPFDAGRWWSARLSAAGLSEPGLLALLAGPASPAAGLVPRPWWLERLDRALADGRDQGAVTGGWAGESYFGGLVTPLAAQAAAELEGRLRAIPGCSGVVDPARVDEPAERPPVRRTGPDGAAHAGGRAGKGPAGGAAKVR